VREKWKRRVHRKIGELGENLFATVEVVVVHRRPEPRDG